MSINTTSTSDRLQAASLTSSPAQEEGAQKIESVSPFAVALPDPAVIARLANEFFAARPRQRRGAPGRERASGLAEWGRSARALWICGANRRARLSAGDVLFSRRAKLGLRSGACRDALEGAHWRVE